MRVRGKMTKLTKVIVPVMVVGLIVAACGGGGDPTAAPPPPPSSAPTATPAPTATLEPAATVAPLATRAATATARPAPTPTPPPTPVTGPQGELVMAIPSFGDDLLDPNLASVVGLQPLSGPIYDGLTYLTPGTGIDGGKNAPGIAVSWEASPDASAFTYKIRQGMKFHDGTDVTVEDVAWSAERFADPEAPSNPSLIWRRNVANIEIVDEQTVRFTATRPRPQLPVGIGFRGGTVFPKAALEAQGAEAFFEKPIATGPWKLVDRQPGVKYTYEPSGIDHPFRASPAFARLVMRLIPEESTRVALIRTGSAQITDMSPGSVPSVRRSNITILEAPGTAIVAVQFWGARNPELFATVPLGDVRVREALKLAVNRQQIIDVILNGFGELPPRNLITQLRDAWDPTWEPTPYDPERARELLAEAGYADGFELTYFTTAAAGFPFTQPVIEAVAGFWDAIGVKTKLEQIDTSTHGTLTRERPLPARIVGTVSTQASFQSFSIDLFILLVCFYGSGFCPGISLLPAADAFAGELLREFDPQKRIELSRAIINAGHDAHIDLPIVLTPKLFAVSPDVTGDATRGVTHLGGSLETFRPVSS